MDLLGTENISYIVIIRQDKEIIMESYPIACLVVVFFFWLIFVFYFIFCDTYFFDNSVITIKMRDLNSGCLH